MTIAVLCAAAVGSVGGGLIALHVSTESPSAQATTGSIGGHAATSATPPKPAVTAQPITPPDPHTALVAQIHAVLRRVPEWTRTHPGAPCPEVAALGVSAIDPWGHKIELTCTDQPADQILGAISPGPDGIRGNVDDVESWNLGPTVTQLVQGRRWTSTSGAPAAPLATKPPSGKRRKDATSTSDRNSRPPRSVSAKPSAASATSAAPTSTATATTQLPPAARPSIAPAPPIDAGDGIPTRR